MVCLQFKNSKEITSIIEECTQETTDKRIIGKVVVGRREELLRS